ncbi:MAG: hypothetical protein ACRDN0_06110 [Trebonia sp.]
MPRPADVTAHGLDVVAGRLVRDIAHAAVATSGSPGYDWWKVLFALYPNSPATHTKRSGVPGKLASSIERLFQADPPGVALSPCVFCGQPAGTLWGKDRLPMFDSLKAVNRLPPRLAGWPTCRACRIAMWALPYGAWVTAGSAAVVTCADDAVERRFTQRNVRRAHQVQDMGFSSLPGNASPETLTLAALRDHSAGAAVGSTLWIFKNDNQDAWLRVTATRAGIPAFLSGLLADPDCRAGWGALVEVLTERDKDGQLRASGVSAAARTLFDPADRLPGGVSRDGLERELLRRAEDPSCVTGRTLTAWRALCRLYLEVVHGMDTGQVKSARELIVDWIMAEQNPRGRFNRYVRAATRPFELQRLFIEASARLLLDGGNPPDITGAAISLLAPDTVGWRLRGLLFFDVVADLVGRDASVGRKPAIGEPEVTDEDLSRAVTDPPASDEETEEHSG